MSLLDDTLTDAHPAADRDRYLATVPGQASFAIVGTDKRCFGCKFWDFAYKSRLQAKPCLKYQELMSGKRGAAIPPSAHACKYFEAKA